MKFWICSIELFWSVYEVTRGLGELLAELGR